MKKCLNQSKSIFTLLIVLLLFNSCGHYKHKILTSEKKNLVHTVKAYNGSRTYNNKKVDKYYVVHYKDSIYHVENVRFNPEFEGVGIRAQIDWDEAHKKERTLKAEIVSKSDVDALSRYKDSIYNYMLENPKGSLKPMKTNMHYVYQTHLFLDSMNVVDNTIEISQTDIHEAHFFYKSRFVQRMVVLASIGAIVIALVAGVIVSLSNS